MHRLVSHRSAVSCLAAATCLVVVSACSFGDDSDSSPTSSSSSSSSAPSESSPNSNQDADVIANPPSKTSQEALAAAQKEFSGDVTKIELERQQGGGLEYKIELVSDKSEYSVQYDAETLEMISDKSEDLGDDAAEDRKKSFDPDTVIDLDQAVQAARKQQDGTIGKWKIEGKDTGRVQYEFDIRLSGSSEDVEVQIDAKDGSVVKDD